MNSRTNAIRRQFNRSAGGSYDIHALVQRTMADRLVKCLIEKRNVENQGHNEGRKNILDIGCGTGALTEMLLNLLPGSSFTALDIAPAMITAAEQRIRLQHVTNKASGFAFDQSEPRVRFLLADVETWAADAPTDSYDLIVSNACFQWLSRPRETLTCLRRLLLSGGELAFATFGPDTFRELHEAFDDTYRFRGIKPQRHGLLFQTIDQWKIMLREAGFENISYDHSVTKEIHASVGDFLHSVKAVGASTSEASASRGIGSRRLLTDMFKAYEDKFSIGGGVVASYDLLYIHATVP